MSTIFNQTFKFKLGDVICIEKPAIAQVLYEDVKGKACDNCTIDNPNLKKCSGCKHMWYCSEECQKQDWKYAHKYECRDVYKNHYDEMFSPHIRILLRLYNAIENNKSLASRKVNDFIGKSFNDMPTYKEKIEKDAKEMLEFASICASLNKCKIKFHMPTMFDYFCKMRANATFFVNRFKDGNNFFIYVSWTSFKHSCVPNAICIVKEAQMEIRALKDIKTDEEIFISVIELNQNREGRQKELKTKFFPECACSRCTSDFDKEFDYKRLAELLEERKKYDNVNFNGDKVKRVVIPPKHLYEVEKEILKLFKIVYGEFHPRVTEILMVMAKNIVVMRKMGFDPANFNLFFLEVFFHLKINQGFDLKKCKEYLENLVDSAKKAVFLNLTEEEVMKL